MKKSDAQLIEKYQKLYFDDPTSNAFAPLSEAYRKAGMLKEARDLCQKGLDHNPHFAGGHVAMARSLIDLNQLSTAIEHLTTAVRLAPENLLAHELLGQSYLQSQKPKAALSAFKMLLFVAPEHEDAQEIVKKLESITADEYEEDTFQMKPLAGAQKNWYIDDLQVADSYEATKEEKRDFHMERVLERLISLADAYMVRNDIENATEVLKRAESQYGPDPELVKRLNLIHSRQLDMLEEQLEAEDIKPLEPRVKLYGGKKVKRLQNALKNITKNRKEQ